VSPELPQGLGAASGTGKSRGSSSAGVEVMKTRMAFILYPATPELSDTRNLC
jgi:hypothetical protein